ncbi:hypothetical protein VQ643_08350 [Pseudomonas sp. F1_0610]|uniref:hypothetical protein n=1 Tax=Pseudomonas sp. F1_0610 TaxID=3114284 RepID=UPI0039C0E4D2
MDAHIAVKSFTTLLITVFFATFGLSSFAQQSAQTEILRAQKQYAAQRKNCEEKDYNACFAAADSLMLLERGDEALRIYHKICVDQLYERACNMAVYMLSEGISTPRNIPKAIELGEYMCTNQIYQGCFVAGDLYAEDKSNPQYYFNAKELLTIACKKGQLIQACYNLNKIDLSNVSQRK